jgi:hypothetical protein
VGPFRHRIVVVDGWRVPLLTASLGLRGIVHLTLDERIGFDAPVGEADYFVRFLAHAIAIGLGYASHLGPEDVEPKRLPVLRPRRVSEVRLMG